MGSEDQALIVQSKKSRSSHHRSKYSHQRNNSRKPRDKSKFICYTCDEKEHLARDFPKNKSSSHKKNGNKRRHHAHAAEVNLHQREPDMKVKILQARMNMF